MEIILTQYYNPKIKAIFDLTTKVNSKYAAKNGYQYKVDSTSRCPERNPEWEKIAWLNVLLSQIPDGNLVIYEDCDSINVGGDLSTILPGGFNIGMVSLRGGANSTEIMGWYNSGVIAILNSQSVRDFFNSVFNLGANLSNDEQGIMLALKNSNQIVCSLPISWNTWSNNEKIGDDVYIKSFHGLGLVDKRLQILDYIKNNNL